MLSGDSNFNGGYESVPVSQPHGNCCAVRGSNGDCNILQRQLCKAGVCVSRYVAFCVQVDHSFLHSDYDMRVRGKMCDGTGIRFRLLLKKGLKITDIGGFAVY